MRSFGKQNITQSRLGSLEITNARPEDPPSVMQCMWNFHMVRNGRGVSKVKPPGRMSEGCVNAGIPGRVVSRHGDIWCADSTGENKEIGQQHDVGLSIYSPPKKYGWPRGHQAQRGLSLGFLFCVKTCKDFWRKFSGNWFALLGKGRIRYWSHMTMWVGPLAGVYRTMALASWVEMGVKAEAAGYKLSVLLCSLQTRRSCRLHILSLKEIMSPWDVRGKKMKTLVKRFTTKMENSFLIVII